MHEYRCWQYVFDTAGDIAESMQIIGFIMGAGSAGAYQTSIRERDPSGPIFLVAAEKLRSTTDQMPTITPNSIQLVTT